ncbi:MAG TPA: hypothetical protein PLJ50_08845, partial [Candidatus Latescibacteria bacterium]|nr:hypothetical protein [Candidatus Latescibacterota bacterium]
MNGSSVVSTGRQTPWARDRNTILREASNLPLRAPKRFRARTAHRTRFVRSDRHCSADHGAEERLLGAVVDCMGEVLVAALAAPG